MRARRIDVPASRAGQRMLAGLVSLLVVLVLAAGGQGAEQAAAKPLRVGMSRGYAPLAFTENGKPAGVEPDLAKLLETELGRKLEIVQMPLSDLIPALVGDKIDIIMSGLSITEERSEKVLFIKPYLRTGQMALVRRADLVKLADPAAMSKAGAKVGVRKGSTGEGYARTNLKDATIITVDSVKAGADKLRKGEIDYFVHDAPAIWRLTGHASTRDEAFAGLYRPLTEEHIAWAVRKDDAALAKQLNTALDHLAESGKLQQVLDKWIPVTKVAVGAPAPTGAKSP